MAEADNTPNMQWSPVVHGRPRLTASSNWEMAVPDSRPDRGQEARNKFDSVAEILAKAERAGVDGVALPTKVIAYNGYGWDVVHVGKMSDILPQDGRPVIQSEGKDLPPYNAKAHNGRSAYDCVRAGEVGMRVLGYSSEGVEFPTHIPVVSDADAVKLHQKYVEPGFHHANGRKPTEFTHPSTEMQFKPIEEVLSPDAITKLKQAYESHRVVAQGTDRETHYGQPIALFFNPETKGYEVYEEYAYGDKVTGVGMPVRKIKDSASFVSPVSPEPSPPAQGLSSEAPAAETSRVQDVPASSATPQTAQSSLPDAAKDAVKTSGLSGMLANMSTGQKAGAALVAVAAVGTAAYLLKKRKEAREQPQALPQESRRR